MIEIFSKFLLADDKLMPEMHLRPRAFTYSACGKFIKNKERIQKIKEIRDSRYIYQNRLDKAFFQHDMAYDDFEDLTRKTAFDKMLRHKAFNIGINLKYDGYQRCLALIVCKCFDEKTSGSGIKNDNISNQCSLDLPVQQIAEELHKSIIRNF